MFYFIKKSKTILFELRVEDRKTDIWRALKSYHFSKGIKKYYKGSDMKRDIFENNLFKTLYFFLNFPIKNP